MMRDQRVYDRNGMENTPVHPATLDDEALLKHCRVDRGRASGPGGQHRNKVETAITLHHLPTGVSAAATERRSQAENQRVALFRLRLKLALEVRSKVDLNAASALWQARRAGTQLAVNAAHRDFPALLAEALDAIHAAHDDLPIAAGALGVSKSQLIKLLGQHPPALARLNDRRRASGLPRLR